METIADEKGFAALRDAWNALAGRMQASSVFLTYEWFAAAWAWRRHDADLRILVARDGDAIVAILPLVSRRDSNSRRRVWTLLTVPDTQRCDLIAAADAVDVASAAFASALATRTDWDVVTFDYLAADGLVPNHLIGKLQRDGVRCVIEQRGRNLYIPLDETWEVYWASRSRSLKKACNLANNRLEKTGTVRIERAGPGPLTDAEFDRTMNAVIEISKASWKQETGNSLDHDAPGDFIRSLSAVARRKGWLSLWLAYLDNRPVAMEYQLVFNGAVHALRSDFDASLEQLSPGSFLFRHLLERMFGNGLTEYLMGPGDNAYKTRWTTHGHSLCRVWAYNRTLRGRLAYRLDQCVKPALRPLVHRLRRRG